MRYAMIMATTLVLAGCAKIDADGMIASGAVRIEPHPVGGAVRVTVTSVPDAPVSLSPVDPNRSEGQARLLATLFPPPCAAAEETRLSTGPTAAGLRREIIAFRVACPESR